MRVLVCGGRNFNQAGFLYKTLDAIHQESPVDTIIHGNANGADSIAGVWARKNQISLDVYPARWDQHGRSAGSIRNQQMLTEGKPDLVVAFPGGHGTAHMARLAREQGVEVIKVS